MIGGALAALFLVGAGVLFALSTWGDVNRVLIDRPGEQGDEGSQAESDGQDDRDSSGLGANAPSTRDGLDVFLMVGSDSRDELADTEGFGEFDGQRADVVIVLLRPGDGTRAAILSLPRDLLVEDQCSGGEHRLNDALEGCRDGMNGPTALTLAVESLIGVPIDHFALVDLAGFQDAVDAVGGYEICLGRAVRDQKANLELPAGCTRASGADTLAWLRSRSTQELTDGGWRTVPGVNDLTRNERQREFMMSMMGRLSDFGSPQDIRAIAGEVAGHVTVDSSLTLLDAVGLAWTMRDLSEGEIEEIEISYVDETTEAGAAVLIPSEEIARVVEAYLAPETAEESPGSLTG